MVRTSISPSQDEAPEIGWDEILECCGKKLRYEAAIECSFCKKWYHKSCAGMSEEEFTKFDLHIEEIFSCKICCASSGKENIKETKGEESAQGVPKLTSENEESVNLTTLLLFMKQSRQEQLIFREEDRQEQLIFREEDRQEQLKFREEDRQEQNNKFDMLYQNVEESKRTMQEMSVRLEDKLEKLEIKVSKLKKLECDLQDHKHSCQIRHDELKTTLGLQMEALESEMKIQEKEISRVRDKCKMMQGSAEKVQVLEERVCELGMKSQKVDELHFGIQLSPELISKEENIYEKPKKNYMFSKLQECVTLDVTIPEMTLISKRKKIRMRPRYSSVKKVKKMKRKKLKAAKKVKKIEEALGKAKKKVREKSKNVSTDRSKASMKRIKQENREMRLSEEGGEHKRKPQKKRDKKNQKKVDSGDSHSEKIEPMENRKQNEKTLKIRESSNSVDRLLVSLLEERWKRRKKKFEKEKKKKKKEEGKEEEE